MNTVHRTEVLRLSGPSFVPTCSCGWSGKKVAQHEPAKVEANDHRYENQFSQRELVKK